MTLSDLMLSMGKPELYQKTKGQFWNEEYISAQMLEAHLDPNFEGASRKHEFIDQSAAFISKLVPPKNYLKLVDLGCGPGLYTERFQKAGYQATGVDFSKRSIEYATESAKKQNLDITYLFQDYLSLQLDSVYDFATIIYCDYGALSTDDRRTFLSNVSEYLRVGGKLFFDVFSMKSFQEAEERQTFGVCSGNGFWSKEPYIEFNMSAKYNECTLLSQTTIVQEDKITPYYLWDTYYTRESLTKEVEQSGFKVCGFWGDVSGTPYQEDSKTLAVLLEKE